MVGMALITSVPSSLPGDIRSHGKRDGTYVMAYVLKRRRHL
jgi:hypothetical protein